MGRVFITGDTHQSLDINKLNSKNFPLNSILTKDDISFQWYNGAEIFEYIRFMPWIKRHIFM